MIPADHDLLVRLDENVNAVKNDIKQLHDSFDGIVSDHETRLRLLEKDIDSARGALVLTRIMIGILAAAIASVWYLRN